MISEVPCAVLVFPEQYLEKVNNSTCRPASGYQAIGAHFTTSISVTTHCKTAMRVFRSHQSVTEQDHRREATETRPLIPFFLILELNKGIKGSIGLFSLPHLATSVIYSRLRFYGESYY